MTLTPADTRSRIEQADTFDQTFVGTRDAPYAADYREYVGIDDQHRRMHVLTVGPTGYGKTAVMQHAALQDLYKDCGIAFVNPKGEAIDELLAKLPDDRMDDIVYINPNSDAVPAVNVLEPSITADMTQAERANQQELIVNDLVALFRRLSTGWGDRIEGSLEVLLRFHIKQNMHRLLSGTADPDLYTLYDVYECLRDEDAVTDRLDAADDPVLYDQLEQIRYLSDAETQPARRRFRTFLQNQTVRRWLTQSRSDIAFQDVIGEDRIVFVDAQKGVVGDDAAALVGSLVITKLWTAAQSRITAAPGHRDIAPYYLYIDELDTFSGEGSNFATVLSEAREFGLGCWLATQYLNQLPADLRRAVQNNCRTKLAFNPDSSDNRATIASMLTGVDDATLSRLGKFRAVLQRPAEQQQRDAVVLDTLPPWEPNWELAAERRQQVLDQYGRLADTVAPAAKGKDTASPEHAALLTTAHRHFDNQGYNVTRLQQDPGRDRPDAVAVDSDTDATVHIEAERSTVDKPGRVLQNLRRAHENDATAAFVTTPALADRLLAILTDPVNRHGSGGGEDDHGTYAYYQTEKGPVTDLETLRAADSTVYVATGDELYEYTGDSTTLCPEYDADEERPAGAFASACLYRDPDDSCRKLDAPCVLTDTIPTDMGEPSE